jgi:AcrR family transcriptional regulator
VPRERDQQREEAILRAALELLAEIGYDQLTMDAVAARAHCSKATIYRRWPGKAELVTTAVRRQAVAAHGTSPMRRSVCSSAETRGFDPGWARTQTALAVPSPPRRRLSTKPTRSGVQPGCWTSS